MRRGICLFVFVLFVSVAESPLAGVINVPADQPTIQEGINAAVGGDTVLIADGTYTGAGNRDIDFGGKAITVTSVNGAEATIIDCEQSGRGFIFDSGEDAGSILHGLTILHARADTGAALYINAASPVIEACVFQARDAVHWYGGYFGHHGGGGACLNGSQARFTDCRFVFNDAASGAGLYISDGSDIIVTDCVFERNLTTCSNIEATGAIRIRSASPLITNCVFDRNATDCTNWGLWGSAAIFADNSDVVVSQCVFTGNWSTLWFDIGAPGLCLFGGAPIVENCTFFKNEDFFGTPGWSAACIYSWSDATIRNNIFAYSNPGPRAKERGGPPISWYEDSPAPTVECNVFYDNGDEEWSGPIAAYLNKNGNVYIAPRFCDTANGDFHPDTLSICAPNNNDCGVLIGALPVDSTCSLGCCTGYQGNANCDPLDVTDVTDVSVLIDHLFLTLPPLCCEDEADLDTNGIVDVTDLSILIDNQFLTLTPLPPCR